MLKALEKRLGKLEKTQKANTDRLVDEQEELMRRKTAGN